jgi:two-component system, chemotaxis family, chemotaxis protein CheY
MALVALVVDDSMLIRHTVCRFLEERGFRVEAASNGQEALDTLARVKPDLIVTDMQMPKMGGAELIAVLRSQASTAKIPIVVVASQQAALEEGKRYADCTIHKDIYIVDQLAKALEKTFGAAIAKSQPAGK